MDWGRLPVGKVRLSAFSSRLMTARLCLFLYGWERGLVKFQTVASRSGGRKSITTRIRYARSYVSRVRARGLLGDTLVMDFMFDTGQLLHGPKSVVADTLGNRPWTTR